MNSFNRHRIYFLLLVAGILMSVPTVALSSGNDIAQIPTCSICGMDRHKFSHSRMLLHFEDGSKFGACSLHCAALEMAYDPGKVPARIMVGDFNSRKLIDAEKAAWVLGGSKMGVMTQNAKWAFAAETEAKQYIAQHGGRIVSFEKALSAAYADMYEDTRMIREKRKKMKHMKKKKAHSQGGQQQIEKNDDRKSK